MSHSLAPHFHNQLTQLKRGEHMSDLLTAFDKMTITCIEEETGGMCITFDWDETDPDLSVWTSMPEHEQRSFVLNALLNSLRDQITDASQE